MNPPSEGHFGETAFVPCREVVPISEVCLFFHCITLIYVCFMGVSNDNSQIDSIDSVQLYFTGKALAT